MSTTEDDAIDSPTAAGRSDSVIHNAMLLQFVEGRFVVSSSTDALEINRRDGAISVGSEFGQPDPGALRIYGIIGTIKLLRGSYLIVITDREGVGKIQGERIWKIKDTKIIPYKEYCQLTPNQEEDEEKYLKMLSLVLSTSNFYFSYNFDLTNSLQRRKTLPSDEATKPLWQRVDTRFFWNRYLLEPFTSANPNIRDWIVPIMLGHVAIGSDIKLGQTRADIVIISRRSVHRAGTRFWVRGLDGDGNAANFVETEQIIYQANGDCASFVQIRGSIPVFWTQYVNIMWAPKPITANDSAAAFGKHMDGLVAIYGKPQLLINLANHHGSEGRLVDQYTQQVNNYAQKKDALQYIKFDFHKECPGLNWSRTDNLVEEVGKHLDEIGIFVWKDNAVVSKQTGTVRTNCIDNLDRTNLVQGLIARRWTEKYLKAAGLLTGKIDSNPHLDFFMKNAWADNADAVSFQYAGAGALKSDFTRFGKRTPQGLVQDGINAIQRYVLNNFFDGFRQDAYNLFLGDYRVKPNTSPFQSNGAKVQRYMNWAVLALIFMLLFTNMVMSPISGGFGFFVLVLLYWAAIGGGAFFGIKTYGSKLVDRPKLLPPLPPGESAKPKAD